MNMMRGGSMANGLVTLALLLVPALATAAGTTPAGKLRDPAATPELLVIAHRTCWGEAPEVSLSGIRACDGTGIDGVEIDVRKTRDGALVLIHDTTVDRTTNGTGTVADMTLAEMRALRLRRGAGGRNVVVTDDRVPTLEEGLLAARGRYIVHLDLKTATHADVAPVLARLGMQQQATAWVRGSAEEARQQAEPALGKVVAIVPIVEECGPGSAPSCRPVALSTLQDFAPMRPAGYFFNANASIDFIRQANAVPRVAGARLTAESLWKIDNELTEARHAKWRELIDSGVSMVLTDYPKELVGLLQAEYPNRRGAKK